MTNDQKIIGALLNIDIANQKDLNRLSGGGTCYADAKLIDVDQTPAT
jgi:hypothetical protein